MKDLTQGSIPKHLISMAIPMMISMFVQTLYFLVDLYFVGKLGGAALAGLSLAGNAMFLIFALTQILNVGTATVIAHAVGRKDKQDANLIFNQSMMISSFATVFVFFIGYLGAESYFSLISQDPETIKAGLSYIYWFLPCMALQFIMVSISAALRGTGIVKPTMIAQLLSILINIILAPILIAGWGTGYKMGIAGAGLASSIAVIFGVFILLYHFRKAERYIKLDISLWWGNIDSIKSILRIGFPAGAEFMLMFVYLGTIYGLIQQFGAEAQAGFGLGSRLMQSLFLPAMAIAFAAPAVAGQNFGAQQYGRVRDTFKWSAILTFCFMLMLSILCFWHSKALVQNFSSDAKVLLISSTFLQMIAWNFIPSGLIFTCSGLFQSLGNTWPALISTALRLITFLVPAIWLSNQDDFHLEQLWRLSVATVTLQAMISYYLLRREFNKRLPITD